MDIRNGSDIDFFTYIFDRNEPLDPKSVQLQISVDSTKELFEFLLQLFTEAMKFKYSDDGEKVHLHNCTEKQIEIMQHYFMSFGIYFIYKVYQLNNNQYTSNNKLSVEDKCIELLTKEDMVSYKTVQSNHLQDYKFQILINDVIYIIYFSYIK